MKIERNVLTILTIVTVTVENPSILLILHTTDDEDLLKLLFLGMHMVGDFPVVRDETTVTTEVGVYYTAFYCYHITAMFLNTQIFGI
jgi:hypothetical protein